MTSIVERATKLGMRFDVRGLREFVLIDEKTGATHDFQTADALTDFLSELEAHERGDLVRDRERTG
jgi:hypothetical protein